MKFQTSSLLSSLLENRLQNCQLYFLWAVSANFERFTSRVYMNPLFFWNKLRKKNEICNNLNCLGFSSEDKVVKMTDEILLRVSSSLEEKDFFFGDTPSIIDCLLFGFLQTLTFDELSNCRLHDLVLSHKNVVSFCNNILTTWYPVEEEKKDQTLKHAPPPEEKV